jgi:fatty-acyl-CoA synthase
MMRTDNPPPIDAGASAAKAWLRALELTASIPRNPARILPTVIEELAAQLGDAPALLSAGESLTYRALSERSIRYARWALGQGIAKGEVVGLLMTNRPEYFAIWLGITSMGGVVALLNTNLVGASLAHCVDAVSPKHLIVAQEFADTAVEVLPDVAQVPRLWIHGGDHAWFQRIDLEILESSGELPHAQERATPTIEDRALYIYTSGTTGLPKAASVSHARVMQWSHWFAGMMGTQPEDRIYNCLPMYHSVGGVQVPGAALVSGSSLVIREKFSASNFWSDIVDWDCTMFQYIGELCRYLLNSPPSANESKHRIRLACGNGLAPEIWERFQERFNLPRILEFYASTEGAVSLFNGEGKPGAIGRIPPYLPYRRSVALIRCDVETGEPVRNELGLCIRCAPNESGEAIGKMVDDASNAGTRFEGYVDEEASRKKVLRDVFEPGDAWVRTGDLLRKDEKGFFYFVDRMGDTFRWKGENVATFEVSSAISTFPGVEHATVYGVKIPSTDGRVGMATVVTSRELDLHEFRKHLMSRLPAYARPLFLRIRSDIEVTGTFKYSKTDLADQGYDPVASTDYLYFDNLESQAYVPLDKQLYELIQVGRIRL